MKMKLKGNESQVKMKIGWKLLSQDAKRGTQKKREGAKPKAGKPWKGKGKEKRRPTDTEQDQRTGGGRKRLNQPTTAKPTPT